MNKGFTLVELAIVMTIIGLLIGGILKGQEMIENARSTSLIAQVNSYIASTAAFRDKYGGTAGDMVNAQQRLPNCNATIFCLNGDGDSQIGILRGSGTDHLSDQSGDTVPTVETTMYWKHLLLAGFVSGTNPSSNPADPEWGVTHPSASIGGGFNVLQANDNGDRMYGIWIRLQNQSKGNIPFGISGVHPMTPIRAAMVDRKMDDGASNTGNVQSEAAGSDCDRSGDYDTSTQNNCIMFFKIL